MIDLSRLGDFDGARLLSNLRRAELIEPLAEEALASARRRRRPLSLARDHSGLARLATVLPFVFLAIVVALAQGSATSPRELSAFERDPAWQSEVAFERRRLRNWVEAYRFAKGAWPRSLSALEELSPALVGEPALTASSRGPYYYTQRGDGFVLLEPEH